MAIIGVSAIGAPIDWCMSVSLCRSIVSDGGSLFTPFLWDGWDAGVLLSVFFFNPIIGIVHRHRVEETGLHARVWSRGVTVPWARL